MSTSSKSHDESSLDLLTELAVEGTSNLVEAQKTLLHLAQQENEIVLKGVKDRVGSFLPAAAMTDLVRRSLGTLIGLHQELLTHASKQAIDWIESEKAGKGGRAARLVEAAREGVDTFTRAQKNLLDAVGQEAGNAIRGKHDHEGKVAKKTEVAELAREAGTAFIEAQKKLLDVISQQMNVSVDVATRTVQSISPSRLMPIADFTGEGVRKFVEAETSLIGSMMKPRKPVGRQAKAARKGATRHRAPAAV